MNMVTITQSTQIMITAVSKMSLLLLEDMRVSSCTHPDTSKSHFFTMRVLESDDGYKGHFIMIITDIHFVLFTEIRFMTSFELHFDVVVIVVVVVVVGVVVVVVFISDLKKTFSLKKKNTSVLGFLALFFLNVCFLLLLFLKRMLEEPPLFNL